MPQRARQRPRGGGGRPDNAGGRGLSQEDRFWRTARRMMRNGGLMSPWDRLNANDAQESAENAQDDYYDALEDQQVPGQGQYVGEYPTQPQAAPQSPYGDLGGQVAAPSGMEGFFPGGTFPDYQNPQLPGVGAPGVTDLAAGSVPQATPQASGGKLPIPVAYQTFRQAGFGDEQARLMTAIAMGESGLNPMAHNPNAATGDNSYGLTQVNMLGGLGPARMKEYGLKSNEDLFDPLTNARAAFGISGGGKNFSPWSIYKKGAHNQFLDDVARALQGQPQQGASTYSSLGSQLAPTTGPGSDLAAPPTSDTTKPPTSTTEEEDDEEDED